MSARAVECWVSFVDPTYALLLAFVPGDGVRGLALDSLETVKGSFVTEDLRKREDDCLWRVRWGEGWLYVYLLIEFQSGIERYMAVRLANYPTPLYQDLFAQKALPKDGRLPPVLPIVLYKSYIRKNRPGIALPDIDDLQQVHAVLKQRVE